MIAVREPTSDGAGDTWGRVRRRVSQTWVWEKKMAWERPNKKAGKICDLSGYPNFSFSHFAWPSLAFSLCS